MDRSVLEVCLASIKKNCLSLKNQAGSRFFCPIIKDQAYGHGLLPVAKALQEVGVSSFGVVTTQEARELQGSLKQEDVLIFGPILNPKDMSWICEQKKRDTCY